MKKASLIVLIAASFALVLSLFTTSNAAEEVKSVAWYTANIREAKLKNQQCHDDAAIKAAQTEECANALHALQISFGSNH